MKRVPALMLVAWAVFVSSWFLPVHVGFRPYVEPGSGWSAFLIALRPSGSWLYKVLSISSALSNGLMLFSVVILLARRPTQRAPGWLAWGFVVATTVDLVWAFWRDHYEISALLVGYWSWVASFGLSAVALFSLRWRQAAAAAV